MSTNLRAQARVDLNVLIVDDDILYARSVARLLDATPRLRRRSRTAEALGLRYRTGVCDCANEALAIAAERRVDVFVLDVMMAPTCGIALCRHLRQQSGRDEALIVMTSASTAEEYRVESRDAGADGYLYKDGFSVLELDAIAARWAHRRGAGVDVRISTATARVSLNGQCIKLQPRHLEMLITLIRNRDEMVPVTSLHPTANGEKTHRYFSAMSSLKKCLETVDWGDRLETTGMRGAALRLGPMARVEIDGVLLPPPTSAEKMLRRQRDD